MIDPTVPVGPNALTQDVRDNFAAAKSEITALQEAVFSFLVLPGGSIQAAIDALPSTGGVVTLLPDVTYLLPSTLTINQPNVTLQGSGWNTIIRRTAGMTGHLVEANASATRFVIRNVTADGNGPANTAGNFEICVNGANSLIQHCQVINAGAQGHIALSGADSRADDNTITGLGSATQGGYGIWAIGGDKVFVTNNHITGTAIDAIGFNGAGTQVVGNHIANCQCYAADSTIGGGQIAHYAVQPSPYDGALIAGNVIERGGGEASTGIELYGQNVTVIGNVIKNQQAQGITLSYISGTDNGILISGNTVMNCGQRAASNAPWVFSGISVFGPLDNIVITGNRFVDTQATPTQTWGVYINPGAYDNLAIIGNDLTGNTTEGASLAGVTGTNPVVMNNIGLVDAEKYLPLIGGTLTGPLTVEYFDASTPSISFNGNMNNTPPPEGFGGSIGFCLLGQVEVNFFNNYDTGSNAIAFSWHQRTANGVVELAQLSRQGEFIFNKYAADGSAGAPYFYSDVTNLHRILVNSINFVIYNANLEVQAGSLLLDHDPTQALEAATKQYADTHIAQLRDQIEAAVTRIAALEKRM